MLQNKIFYTLKPFIPRRLQIFIRRQLSLHKRKKYASSWPIDPSAGEPPKEWTGWPENKRFALLLTHDVDTQKGHDNTLNLLEMEEKLGFRSSFNFVPERYKVSERLRKEIVDKGFEIGLHGLYHDGKLYRTRNIFKERAFRINKYLKEWNAEGFRSPAMHHNLDWLHDLNIRYDASTFDTDPFEPQPTGVGTIFPFWVNRKKDIDGYVELPYTLPQDFTLYILLEKKNTDIWRKKLDWIAEKGGMALVNTHPDYMNFGDTKTGQEEYPVTYYIDFLEYISNKYKGHYFHTLPKDLASFWREKFSKGAV